MQVQYRPPRSSCNTSMLLLSEHFDVNNVAPVRIYKKDLADGMHFKVALKVIGHQRLIVSSLFYYSEGNNTKYIRKTQLFSFGFLQNYFAPILNGVSLFRTHRTAYSPSSYHQFPDKNFSKKQKNNDHA